MKPTAPNLVNGKAIKIARVRKKLIRKALGQGLFPAEKTQHFLALLEKGELEKFNPQRLIQARELAGMSQADLAEKLEQLTQLISLWENGAEIPEPGDIEDLSGALGFPEAFFFRANPPEWDLGSLIWHK